MILVSTRIYESINLILYPYYSFIPSNYSDFDLSTHTIPQLLHISDINLSILEPNEFKWSNSLTINVYEHHCPMYDPINLHRSGEPGCDDVTKWCDHPCCFTVSLEKLSFGLCFRTFFSLVHSIPSPSPLCNVSFPFFILRIEIRMVCLCKVILMPEGSGRQ